MYQDLKVSFAKDFLRIACCMKKIAPFNLPGTNAMLRRQYMLIL